MNQLLKLSSSKVYTVILIIAAGLAGACVPPENNSGPAVNGSANVNTVPVNTAVNTNAAAPAKAENSLSMPVTLPVLDAMFSDEQFAGDLKNKLQLTDEQIDKLKRLSGEAVSNLNESDEANAAGSTRASTERADREIRQILGDDKTNQFFALVRERWTGGVENGSQSAVLTKPDQLPTDSRIVVNAPAYRMDVFENGKLVKTYKIGIGYPEFPLPSGTRKAETIIFNPTWTPPDEPWVKGKLQPGKTVEAGSKLNPLGPIKIPIGLPSLIHGGKAPARLGNFASHGCVGLTDSQIKDFSLELARISGTDLTTEDVGNFGKDKTETKNFKLKNVVPVELHYETIVVENGVLKIYRDVYERGTNTEENLRRVLDAYGVSLDSLPGPERERIVSGLKEMSVDALGNPVASAANTNANSNQSTAAGNKNVNSNSGNVTKNVKGKKELSFELAQLKGKGYPAPVNPVSQ